MKGNKKYTKNQLIATVLNYQTKFRNTDKSFQEAYAIKIVNDLNDYIAIKINEDLKVVLMQLEKELPQCDIDEFMNECAIAELRRDGLIDEETEETIRSSI
jgi:hypothetical protein